MAPSLISSSASTHALFPRSLHLFRPSVRLVLILGLDSSGSVKSPPGPVPPLSLLSPTASECDGAAMGGVAVGQRKEGVSSSAT